MSNPAENTLPEPSRFLPVDKRTDPDGVEMEITERVDTGHISFKLSRLFERERGGPTHKSNFLSAHHVPAIRRLLDQFERDLPLLEDRARMRLRLAR